MAYRHFFGRLIETTPPQRLTTAIDRNSFVADKRVFSAQNITHAPACGTRLGELRALPQTLQLSWLGKKEKCRDGRA